MKLKITLILCCCAVLLSAQEKPSQQWLDRKFSMFIHFGLYSVYGGVYEGEPVRRGYSEQIQSFAGIFSDWYGNTANEFNPVKWNPDSIVSLAKRAGMGSIVFTSKHHDGFCMYHSAYTDYNIVDTTPYGRDLMKELAEACERGGIAFGVYFSLIDWHFPQAYPISSHNADPLTPEHYAFNLKQVEEIMTHYGLLSEIWFDMGSLTPGQSKGLYELVNRLQPQCMISGRLGNDYVDFSVMADNEYPDYQIGVPWQTAASMFDETWGYRSWQERGEVQPKVREKIESLIKVISRGGNFLLNIGPKGDGSVVEFEQQVLLNIGDWVKANSEAIYGARANPFHQTFAWGDITTKEDRLFAFVENIPESGKIELSGFNGKVKGVTQLASGDQLPYTQNEGELEIDLSTVSSGEDIPVLKITFEDGYTIIPPSIVTNGILTPRNAASLYGHSSLNYYAGYKSVIGYDWILYSRKSSVSPQITFTENERGRRIELEIDGRRQPATLEADASETVWLPGNSVKWGNLYRKPGRGVFGNVEEEGIQRVDVNTAGSRWEAVDEFHYGESYTESILQRASVVFLQEIESTDEQTVAVKIESGNAVYILLNGEYVTAHFSPDRVKRQEETVLLPLKKGRNQLIIKYYNGFEKEFSYGITPLDEWTVYTRKLASVPLGKGVDHQISIRSADSHSNVSPLRLNNINVMFR
ncbi:MAG: alpha-L-fucosidase [Proteiniphilum sp.]|uniref:alpha-L-fucosidase n=1 Tax=Proteiniphilum sp. TaxID=1926877 RepID=UPI002B200BE9|nr:alpha-L-fucosidase [Proteiniphilum sp.]MEA5128431.1 alpha-L-fucosidase [Proteiniphilum sp.]